MKKQSDFCLSLESWSTGFEVAECETEWYNTPLHGRKKCHSLHATVIGMFKSILEFMKK